MKILLKSKVYHGLATHDENIINQAKAFATKERISRDAFEFQMLHGIRRDLQQSLAGDGWRMRVYIPFGTEWYPYLMRRLAERPGERAVHRQEPPATITNTSSWHFTILRCHSEERSDEESGFLPTARRTQIPRFARDDTNQPQFSADNSPPHFC